MLLPGLYSPIVLTPWSESKEVAAVDLVSIENREVSRVDERLTVDFDREEML